MWKKNPHQVATSCEMDGEGKLGLYIPAGGLLLNIC